MTSINVNALKSLWVINNVTSFWFFYSIWKLFCISNFHTTCIRYLKHSLSQTFRYLEHSLPQTFSPVPSLFEITSVVCILIKFDLITKYDFKIFYSKSNLLLSVCRRQLCRHGNRWIRNMPYAFLAWMLRLFLALLFVYVCFILFSNQANDRMVRINRYLVSKYISYLQILHIPQPKHTQSVLVCG